MKLKRSIAVVSSVTVAAIGGALSGGSPAHADSWIVCVPYSETTGSCYQRFDDGSSSWFLYWGNTWIEF